MSRKEADINSDKLCRYAKCFFYVFFCLAFIFVFAVSVAYASMIGGLEGFKMFSIIFIGGEVGAFFSFYLTLTLVYILEEHIKIRYFFQTINIKRINVTDKTNRVDRPE